MAMRIALFNLPVDNNYGGMLQRYALMTILQRMGHDVTHLNLRPYHEIKSRCLPYHLAKQLFLHLIHKSTNKSLENYIAKKEYYHSVRAIEPFYQKHIKHSPIITDSSQLKEFNYFDAYVVGSDQVWRRSYYSQFEYTSAFLDFVKDRDNIKRIAYGVSFGTTSELLTDEELSATTPLYRLFDRTSVREESALNIFQKYGWNNPPAQHVIDPTLLLTKEDYIKLITTAHTTNSKGTLLCYILDENELSKKSEIDIASRKNLKPFKISIKQGKQISIEQWLRAFFDAEHVITDSYHGLIFSLIFNKPFTLLKNSQRGNARFASIINLFNLDCQSDCFDWMEINKTIENYRSKSMDFLSSALQVKVTK